MNNKQRFFLIVEGQNDGYPNYNSARILFSEQDPSLLEFKNLFISSPLFSIMKNGYTEIPVSKDGTRITFLMCPNIFPTLNGLITEFSPLNELWFSLGLANLIVIENEENRGLTNKIIDYLTARKNITAYESWQIKDNKICNSNKPVTHIAHNDVEVVNFPVKYSDKLPLQLKFAASEFIISINKFLTASKKYTPHYYKQHCKTIEASIDLVSDLSFLHGDEDFSASDDLLHSLESATTQEARGKLFTTPGHKKKEDLINDRNGRLIQFNSSMSYIYSQAFSGTFPIFDHIGIVRRHSLLGLGSAIGSLFELVSQIEESLYFLPFENEGYSIYQKNIPDETYFDFLIEPSNHKVDLWENDQSRAEVISMLDPTKNNLELPEDFFNRLSFYSGRLGFREYDLSATAAIQVLVEGNSLQWHVINYTHEIIHNHVRMILNNLITPPPSLRNSNDNQFIKKYSDLLSKAYREKDKSDITYKDYFNLILINFSINSRYHGSLTKECNYPVIEKLRTGAVEKETEFIIPPPNELRDLILVIYKDISEIFVHVIDFAYIYKKNLKTYVQSIWASWSTVMAVAYDIKQYVLRTLLIISLSEDGEATNRFDRSKARFLDFLEDISKQNDNSYLFQRIKEMLENEDDKDLRIRFYNCLIVSDLVNNFFVGKLENKLDNNDENRLPSGNEDENGNPIFYNIETNSFEGNLIKSKVRFVWDQLLRACYSSHVQIVDSEKEKTAAWLLLSLSSYNNL